MKKILCVLCVLGGVHFAFALDREVFTFTNYNLQVRVTPEAHSLQGSGKITLRNDSPQASQCSTYLIPTPRMWTTPAP